MPRKGPAAKRPVIVDPVYGSPVVTQLVNKILLDGKKISAVEYTQVVVNHEVPDAAFAFPQR